MKSLVLAGKLFKMFPVAMQRRRVIMCSHIIAAIRANFVHDNSILDESLSHAAAISTMKER